jgi:hypothetical protein
VVGTLPSTSVASFVKGLGRLSEQLSQVAVSPALSEQFESVAKIAGSSALSGLSEQVSRMSGLSKAVEDAFKPLGEVMAADVGLGRLSEQLSQVAVSPALSEQFESVAKIAGSSALSGLSEQVSRMSGLSKAVEDAFKPLGEVMAADVGLGHLSQVAVSPALSEQFESVAKIAGSSALSGLSEQVSRMSGLSKAVEDAFKPLGEVMAADVGLGRLSEQLSQVAVSSALSEQFESVAKIAGSSALLGLTDISERIADTLGLADVLRLEVQHIEALERQLADTWASVDHAFDDVAADSSLDHPTEEGLSQQDARRVAALLFVLSLAYLIQVRTLVAVALEDVARTTGFLLSALAQVRDSYPAVAGAIELFTLIAAAQALRSKRRERHTSEDESESPAGD